MRVSAIFSQSLSLSLFLHLSLSPSLSFSFSPPLSLSLYVYTYLSVCLSTGLSRYLSLALSLPLYLHLHFHLYHSMAASISISVSFSIPYLSVRLNEKEKLCEPSPFLDLRRSKAKRSKSARLPYPLDVTMSKTKEFRETSSISGLGNIKNEAMLRPFLRKRKVEC